MTSAEEWLTEREVHLAPLLERVALIGEIGLSEEETASLGQALGDVLRRSQGGMKKANQRIRERWPRAFVSFLVAQGCFGYEHGNYWQSVRDAVNAEFKQQDWGLMFEDIVANLGLAHDVGGNRYVSAILAHGGIPVTCLPDFFTHLLTPSVARPDWAALDTTQLVDTWLQRSVLQLVDRPVRRFLGLHGEVSTAFVDACREMARQAAEGETLDAVELGLPVAVVEAYETWRDDRRESTPAANTHPWRKPRLCFDLKHEMHVWLPPQLFDHPPRPTSIDWRVSDAVAEQSLISDVRRLDGIWQSDAARIFLHRPAPRYHVTLSLGGQVVRHWTLDAVKDARPLLAFDADTGLHIPLRGDIPNRLMWLLYPPGSRLTVKMPKSAAARSRRALGLAWEWETWHACQLDLTEASRVTLKTLDRCREWAVVTDGALRDVYLAGPGLDGLDDETMTTYLSPPVVRLPGPRPGAPSSISLHGWRIEVGREGNGRPGLRSSLPLTEVWRDDAEGRGVPLADPRLVDDHPWGTFGLRLRDSDGRSRDFRFRVLPVLSLHGHETLVLPGEGGKPPPVTLDLTVDRQTTVRAGGEASELAVERLDGEGGTRYHISVAPTCDQARLLLTRQGAALGFDIPIPRLRWLLALRAEELTADHWRCDCRTIAWDELDQSKRPILLVNAPQLGKNARLALSLEDATGRSVCPLDGVNARPGASLWRFDLAAALDTLRADEWAHLQAVLRIRGDRLAEATRCVFHMTRAIRLEGLSVSQRAHGDGHELSIAWSPTLRLRNRRLRLWPTLCPWRPPIDIDLPDEARDRYVHPLRVPIPSGHYWAELAVHDPYQSSSQPTEPDPDAPNVKSIWLGSLRDRLAELDVAIKASPGIALYAERALVREHEGNPRQMHDDIFWCYLHATPGDEAILAHLLPLVTDDPDGRPLRIRLGHANVIRNMLRLGEASPAGRGVLGGYASLLLTTTLSPEACAALLDAPELPIYAQAKALLLTFKDRPSTEHVLHLVRTNKLLPDEATPILSERVDEAARLIVAQPDSPALVELLRHLVRQQPALATAFVEPGMWVRCQAGWGRIDTIVSPDGTVVPLAGRKALGDGYQLWVTLRPGTPYAERVVVDKARGEVRFEDAQSIYICTLCHKFATRDKGLLGWRHCCSRSTGGTVPHHRQSATLLEKTVLQFQRFAPTDIWA